MQISNNDQKKDTPIKSYDQISFLDDLQCKTNSFSRDLFVFVVQKNYKIPKKVLLLSNNLFYFKDAKITCSGGERR